MSPVDPTVSHAKCYSAPWAWQLGLSTPVVRSFTDPEAPGVDSEFFRLEPVWRGPGQVSRPLAPGAWSLTSF